MDIQNYLITLNSRGKVQVVDLLLKQLLDCFEIHRVTGQLGGKQTIQPVITIEQGKAKRVLDALKAQIPADQLDALVADALVKVNAQTPA